MIATVYRPFVDKKKNKKYSYGDVVTIARAEFERFNGNRTRPLLVEGKHDLGTGVCHPCLKYKNRRQQNG